MYEFPVFLPRTRFTRSKAYVILLLAGDVYLQVRINSPLATSLKLLLFVAAE